MTFRQLADEIATCPRKGSCPLGGYPLVDSESHLGCPDSPVVFLGTNPGSLEGYHYPYGLDERFKYLSTTGLTTDANHKRWRRYHELLEALNAACGTQFSLAKGNVLILNVVKCSTKNADPLKKWLPSRLSHGVTEFETACACSKQTLYQLNSRRRIIIAHGVPAWVWAVTRLSIYTRMELREAARSKIVHAGGKHLVIPSYHLSPGRPTPVDETLPIVKENIREHGKFLKSVLDSGEHD